MTRARICHERCLAVRPWQGLILRHTGVSMTCEKSQKKAIDFKDLWKPDGDKQQICYRNAKSL